MFVQVANDGGVTLQDAENFRAFKLVVGGGEARLDAARQALSGTADVPDAATAWISPTALVALHGADAAWEQSLAAMIEKARPHGWIHPDTGAIRAHIEYA